MTDLLHPAGDLDVLLYYSKVAPKLKGFLKGKEIAARVLIPNFRPLLNRGSKLPPLSAEELAKVDEALLKMRSGGTKLESARGGLTPLQEKIWRYFPPRKLADLFYATNTEKGKKIDRIFFDLDRGEGTTLEEAQKATALLVEEMHNDEKLKAALTPGFEFFIMYTGSSFHIYLMLKKEAEGGAYDKHFAYSKNDPLSSLTGRWVESVRKNGIRISGGHEKLPGYLVLDPSQTPPGKLARAPFSLHMSDPKTVDGVAIPIEEKMLKDKNLPKKLKGYGPEKVLEELDSLTKLLPC